MTEPRSARPAASPPASILCRLADLGHKIRVVRLDQFRAHDDDAAHLVLVVGVAENRYRHSRAAAMYRRDCRDSCVRDSRGRHDSRRYACSFREARSECERNAEEQIAMETTTTTATPKVGAAIRGAAGETRRPLFCAGPL